MTRRGWLLFGAMSVLWGIPYLFIRVAVKDLDGGFVVFARVGIATLVLLPLAVYRGVLRELAGKWPAVVLLSFAQIIGPFLLITYGEVYLSSSLASLLIAADPLLVAVLALWLDHSERVDSTRMLGLAVGAGGVVLLLGFQVGGDGKAMLGAAIVVLAATGYAIGALMLRRPTYATLPGLGVVSAECLIATVVLAPLAAFQLPSHLPQAKVLGSLAALGVLCTALAWLAFFALIAEVGASRGTVFTYVNPAVAVALGVLLLGEPLTGWTVAGFLLIVAGSWLSTGGSLPPGLSGRKSPSGRPRTTGSAARNTGAARGEGAHPVPAEDGRATV